MPVHTNCSLYTINYLFVCVFFIHYFYSSYFLLFSSLDNLHFHFYYCSYSLKYYVTFIPKRGKKFSIVHVELWLFERLAMKPCKADDKGAVIQFLSERPLPSTVFCFNAINDTVYLNRSISIGQLIQHISKSIVAYARSMPRMLTKASKKKKFIRLHNHCLLLINYESSVVCMLLLLYEQYSIN